MCIKYYLQHIGSPIWRFIWYLKTKWWSSWRGEFKNCSDWQVPCSGWSYNTNIEATSKFALQIAARRQSLNTKLWLLLSVCMKFAIENFRILWDFKDSIFQCCLDSNDEMIMRDNIYDKPFNNTFTYPMCEQNRFFEFWGRKPNSN